MEFLLGLYPGVLGSSFRSYNSVTMGKLTLSEPQVLYW